MNSFQNPFGVMPLGQPFGQPLANTGPGMDLLRHMERAMFSYAFGSNNPNRPSSTTPPTEEEQVRRALVISKREAGISDRAVMQNEDDMNVVDAFQNNPISTSSSTSLPGGASSPSGPTRASSRNQTRSRRGNTTVTKKRKNTSVVKPTSKKQKKHTTAAKCVVCLEDGASFAVIPCRHMCICAGCVSVFKQKGGKACPVCNKAMSELFEIFY